MLTLTMIMITMMIMMMMLMTIMMMMVTWMAMVMIWLDMPRWWRHSWWCSCDAKGNEKRFYKIDIVNFKLHIFLTIVMRISNLAVTRTLQKTRRVVVHL